MAQQVLIRDAEPSDLAQVCAINGYYVRNTVRSRCTSPTSTDGISSSLTRGLDICQRGKAAGIIRGNISLHRG